MAFMDIVPMYCKIDGLLTDCYASAHSVLLQNPEISKHLEDNIMIFSDGSVTTEYCGSTTVTLTTTGITSSTFKFLNECQEERDVKDSTWAEGVAIMEAVKIAQACAKKVTLFTDQQWLLRYSKGNGQSDKKLDIYGNFRNIVNHLPLPFTAVWIKGHPGFILHVVADKLAKFAIGLASEDCVKKAIAEISASTISDFHNACKGVYLLGEEKKEWEQQENAWQHSTPFATEQKAVRDENPEEMIRRREHRKAQQEAIKQQKAAETQEKKKDQKERQEKAAVRKAEQAAKKAANDERRKLKKKAAAAQQGDSQA